MGRLGEMRCDCSVCKLMVGGVVSCSQGDLSLRRGGSTAHSRMDAINKETLSQYFTLLKDFRDECNLLDHPAQIYNVGESGIPFDFKTPNVMAAISTKKVQY